MSNGAEIAALLAHTEWTRELARSLAGDVHQADDLVQDAWVAALERPPRLDRPLRGWLAAVLRRRLSDLRRQRRGREHHERAGARGEALPSSDELVQRAATQRALVEAVLELEEPYRATVLLRFFEDLPPREIARRAGIPVATVQSRLTRALERLRARLARGGGRTAWLSALAPLLSEPLAPLAILGVPVMKLIGLALTLSALLGLFLWSSRPAEPEPSDGPPAVSALSAPPSIAPGTAGSAGGAPSDRVYSPTTPGPRLRPPAPEPARASAPAVTATARHARGRVLDARGVGLSGLELALASRSGAPLPEGARTISGAGGWFEIELDPGAEQVVAADPAYTTVLAGVVRALEETRPLVVVAPRIELAGRVLDPDGVPVAGAEVGFELPPGFGNEWGLALDYALALGWRDRSASDGSFALAGVPSVDEASLRASLGGFVPFRELAPRSSTRTLEIVLARPGPRARLLRGIVIDPNGAPVAGARVGARAESTLSRDDGSFTLDLAQPGARPPVVAVLRGYVPASFEPGTGSNGEPLWPPTVVLRLGGTPSALEGHVVDDEGAPVAGARVWLDDPSPLGDVGRDRIAVESVARGDERFWSYEETGTDGSFRIEGLEPRSYRVKAMDPRNLLQVEAHGLFASDSPVELRLPTHRLHARVAGRVISSRGEPVPGALVRLFRTTFTMPLAEGRQSDGAQAQAQITADDGSFAFHDVPEDVALLVTGESILFAFADVEHEREVESIEIVARLRLQLQIQLDPPLDRADAFEVLDSAGRRLVLSIVQGDGPFHGPRMELVGGRSAVISLDEDAATLVLLHGEEIVSRVPLSLAPGEVNEIHP